MENLQSKSWYSEPLCLGLTRLNGGILFGTMILLSLGSIAGLIVSIVLYFTDPNTNSQWKILGMAVCSIMLLTVLITLCIFIYCYKKGHIKSKINPENTNLVYGRMYNASQSITSTNNDESIQVKDKLTNTIQTISPLRPRDIQQGVWQGQNAYNGQSRRSIYPLKMINREIEVQPNDIDRQQGTIQDQQQTIIHIPLTNHRRTIESEYELRETTSRRPNPDEIIEIIHLPKRRFTNVSVRRIRNNDDEFYQ